MDVNAAVADSKLGMEFHFALRFDGHGKIRLGEYSILNWITFAGYDL